MNADELKGFIVQLHNLHDAVAAARRGAQDTRKHEAPADVAPAMVQLDDLLAAWQVACENGIATSERLLAVGFPDIPHLEVLEATFEDVANEVSDVVAMQMFLVRTEPSAGFFGPAKVRVEPKKGF